MNAAKIAANYPYYLDTFRHLHTGRRIEDMMATRELALRLLANAEADRPNQWVKLRDQDNPVHRFDELGLPSEEELRELVSPRQFNWVCQQMLAQPQYSDDLAGMLAKYEADHRASTGWQVTAHEVMPALVGLPGQVVPAIRSEGQYLTWSGSEQALAGLLRGLRAIRAKRRKRVRKLIAQLWAYHLRQPRRQGEVVELRSVVTETIERRIAA